MSPTTQALHEAACAASVCICFWPRAARCSPIALIAGWDELGACSNMASLDRSEVGRARVLVGSSRTDKRILRCRTH
jgi:hypothetical protein